MSAKRQSVGGPAAGLSDDRRASYGLADRPSVLARATMTDVNTPTDEQRLRFERMCLLRSLYARRGPRDATGVMPLSEVAAYARALLIDAYWRADTARSADSPA
jgi:hypothetical protein